MEGPRAGGLGIAIAGGGARPVFGIGMLREVMQAGVKVDALAGVSSGAIVALYMAKYWNHKQAEEKAAKLLKGFAGLSGVGLMDFRLRVRALLTPEFENVKFEDLPLQVAITAYDLYTRRSEVFHQGPVLPPLLGSIAYPGLMPPIKFKDGTDRTYRLIDGGLGSPLGTVPFLQEFGKRNQIERVIVAHFPSEVEIWGMQRFNAFLRQRGILLKPVSQEIEKLEQAFPSSLLMVEPSELRRVELRGFHLSEWMYELGKRYSQIFINQLHGPSLRRVIQHMDPHTIPKPDLHRPWNPSSEEPPYELA